jgi:hypothetical protein
LVRDFARTKRHSYVDENDQSEYSGSEEGLDATSVSSQPKQSIKFDGIEGAQPISIEKNTNSTQEYKFLATGGSKKGLEGKESVGNERRQSGKYEGSSQTSSA